MNPITITIPGRPKPLQRHRMTRGGHSYDPTANKFHKQAVQADALAAMRGKPASAIPRQGPLAIEAVFTFLRPKSAPKSRTMPEVKPDIDNLVKLLLDALNGVVWRDDAQVVQLVARKVYGETEQTRLVVSTPERIVG